MIGWEESHMEWAFTVNPSEPSKWMVIGQSHRRVVIVNELRLRARLRILAGWPVAVAIKALKGTLPPAAKRGAA